MQIKNYLPEPIAIKNNPRLSKLLNNNPTTPREIINRSLNQLAENGELNHPYNLIFSFHKYTPPPPQ